MGKHVIGVDVGGTKVAAATLDGGRLSEPRRERTDVTDAEALLVQLARVIGEAADSETAAVGLAIPSVVDVRTGTSRNAVNVPLRDVAIKAILQQRLGLPVFVQNDASCAGLAEAYDDDGALLYDSLAIFTVGTGVGGGVVLGGRIHGGATGAAGEFGHMLISAETATGVAHAGVFPQVGSLEANAAGRVLDNLGRDRGFDDGPAVVAQAQAGDPVAVELLELLGRRLGLGIANVINVLDPDVVVVGGGVSAAGDLLLVPATETAREYTLPGAGTMTEIRIARYGANAGVRGAALYAALELATTDDHITQETLRP